MAETTQLMAKLGPNQTLYLSHDGTHTTVTIMSHQAGQQQQSASQIATGPWTAQPQLFQLSQGYVGILTGSDTQHTFYIQGNQVQVSSGGPSEAIASELKTATPIPFENVVSTASSTSQVSASTTVMGSMQPPMQPMDPMQPMKPMQPMSMGNMSMSPLSANPMTMTMGDMSMSMGLANKQPVTEHKSTGQKKAAQKDIEQKSTQKEPAEKETTQQKVKRFCSQCGEAISVGDRFCAYCGHSLD